MCEGKPVASPVQSVVVQLQSLPTSVDVSGSQ